MKHLKTFEIVYPIVTKYYTENKEPEIGDYVICEDGFNEAKEFLQNNIGQYINIDEFPVHAYCHYLIKYENVPHNLQMYFNYNEIIGVRPMRLTEIKHFSSNKEELEALLAQNKYNL